MRELDPAYGLGLDHGSNRLVDYNPLWPKAFVEEAGRLKSSLGNLAIAIEHYGSTSVPGLCAKPILDIAVGVADIDDGLTFIEPLAARGYDYAGGQGIPEHHIFGRGKARTHLVHVVVYEGDQWVRMLAFRDRLRNEPEVRAAYEALKRDLAAQQLTRAQYSDGKTAFLNEVCPPDS